jgi:enamine deaminase RidA (YjgF/YER057c/UK114 family)
MAKRQIIQGPGIPAHRNPIPPAIRIGNMVYSSVITGQDPETGAYPDAIEAQIRNAFRTVRTIMERAGGSPADIAKIGVYLRDREDRKYLNPAWLEMFPDENDRPARHTIATQLDGPSKVQLEFTAVL